ncbi:Peroxyureidoacrylate/ureidoacrylate amidohydrolase RutB, partial [Tetrabaena socialis]
MLPSDVPTTCLIVVDMQNDFCLPTSPLCVAGAMGCLAACKLAVEAARAKHLPVIWVIREHHTSGVDVEYTRAHLFKDGAGSTVPGSEGADLVAGLEVGPGELVVVKKRFSGFLHTHLDLVLRWGNTCLTSFSAAKHHDPASGSLAQAMRKQAKFSAESQSNGALMRIAPLAVWGCRLSDPDLAAAAIADAQLTHPHAVPQHANAAYCVALKHLIGAPGDAQGAAAAATAWATAHACSEVTGWLKEALGSGPGHAVNHNIGHVRHAFFYAFRHL